MSANQNKPPMSPLGRMVFEMMNSMNEAYAAGRRIQEIDEQRRRHIAKPALVVDPINRVSEGEKL